MNLVRAIPVSAIFLAALAAALPARAQVFKCLDAQGRTTYQQSPCPKDGKGAQVELTPNNGVAGDAPELEAKWAAAAKQGQVQAGMPRRFVQLAWGAPAEVRPGTPADRASEIWIYRGTGGIRRVGFLDGRVAWERADGSSVESARNGASDTSSRGGNMPAGRSSVSPGQDCEKALAAAGSPERSEAVILPSPGRDGRPIPTQGMRYVFDNDGGAPPQSMAIVCLNGLVSDIQRPAR